MKNKQIDSKNLMFQMYRLMNRIRFFERAAYELYMEGELPGFMHISIGQEATAVGACSALQKEDFMGSTHRGHGDTIAKGVEIGAAMSELFGKRTGACKAKGGSMHISDFSKGILGANGIVAAGVPIATGAALSMKMQKKDHVVLCFFGDGAFASGPVHECLNVSSLWKLPIIYIRQNNQYAESTPKKEYMGVPDIVQWAQSYGMPARRVDGNDVLDVYENVLKAAKFAREGNGPTFIESETYRWYGHNIGDPGLGRPKEEVEQWKKRDPIPKFRKYILDNAIAGSMAIRGVR